MSLALNNWALNDRPGQIVPTQIKLLLICLPYLLWVFEQQIVQSKQWRPRSNCLKEQFDLDLYCLPFSYDILDTSKSSKVDFSHVRSWYLALKVSQYSRSARNRSQLIMVCYIVPWVPSWLSDQIAFSNPESDVVWRISRLPPWPPSWVLKLSYLAILNLMSPPCLLSSFGSIWLMLWEEIWFEEFQDSRHGDHLGYQNRMIVAILNLHNTQVPPIKFKLNLTYRSGADMVWRI